MKKKLTALERETVILFNEAEQTASVYTFNPALQRQLAAFCSERPEAVKLMFEDNPDGVKEYSVPKSWIKIRPPRQLNMTAEARAAAAVRLAVVRTARNAQKSL